jgi:hypothetical protein
MIHEIGSSAKYYYRGISILVRDRVYLLNILGLASF